MTYSIDGNNEEACVTITVTIGSCAECRDWHRDRDDVIDCWDMPVECYHWLRQMGLSHDQCGQICWDAEHVGT